MCCPIDPQARPLPGTLKVREQTARTLIHIDPLAKPNTPLGILPTEPSASSREPPRARPEARSQ